jgi:hypothetical protein
VPKKRGPKTDVLEALLKRVDGLERRLKDEKKSNASQSPNNEHVTTSSEEANGDIPTQLQRPQLETSVPNIAEETAVYTPSPARYVGTHITFSPANNIVLLHQPFHLISFSIPISHESTESRIIYLTKLQQGRD